MHFIFFLSLAVSQPTVEKVTWHADRAAPWIIEQPDFPLRDKIDPESLAQRYLDRNRTRFGLPADSVQLKAGDHQHSLLGHHFHFTQFIDGIAVEHAEIVVSIDRHTGAILRVTNDTWPLTQATTPKRPPVMLAADDALDVAWSRLQVSGHLLSLPQAHLCYLVQNGDFRLIFRVTLATEAPFGFWSLAVDAVTGAVLSLEDTGLYRRPKQTPTRPSSTDLADRAYETVQFLHRETARNRKRFVPADGTALVFDPDPRTTLMDATLGDGSDAIRFEPAYLRRTLRDVRRDDVSGDFFLDGPYCVIENLIDPNLEPAVSADGSWDFSREDSGFHDAMTYFHIDQNQRYVQSLGFLDQQGIQDGPITADSNGIFDLIPDNSTYDPVSNTLVFGPGCVDDSEDADVLLHEYGHALQYAINPNWSGGHTGPMGEGFADYWGGVYSLGTPNGPLFHPAWIYSWDGHGESAPPGSQAPIDACWSGFAEYPEDFCWCGRYLNAFHAVYNPANSYAAPHMENFNGEWYWHAELWGTPLFQAASTLYRQGYPLAEANRIVLESQFGRGADLTMPILAAATVDTAAALYPDGPHAEIFQNAFARHGILPPQPSYDYLTIHVPPAAREWTNEILFHNPNNVDAHITLTVYESDTPEIGLSDYAAHAPESLTMAAGATLNYQPSGENQRWVAISSDQPLIGTGFLQRSLTGLGQERAGIPMFAGSDIASTIIYPHIPADRDQFFSSAVLLNPGDQEVYLHYALYGADGADLSHLLAAGAPTQLGPRQKWVTFLAPAFGAEGMFADENSAARVSYVKITGTDASGLLDRDLAGFQLFGYKVSGDHVASSGIKAIADTSASPDGFRASRIWPVRVSLTGSDFTSFSILNLNAESADLSVKLIFRDGRAPVSADLTIGGNRKLLGLNNAQGFSFPFGGEPVFQFGDGSGLQAMLVTSSAPLRIFEFAGDNAKSVLDGAATTGLTSHTVFTGARGILEILRVGYPGEPEEAIIPAGQQDPRTITITYLQPGLEAAVESFVLKPGALLTRTIPGDGDTSVEITGSRFVATMIDLREAQESLTIVNGQQVAYNPKFRN